MAGRHVIALTNSEKAADVIAAVALADVPESLQRRWMNVGAYGSCVELSVDADEYERWLVLP